MNKISHGGNLPIWQHNAVRYEEFSDIGKYYNCTWGSLFIKVMSPLDWIFRLAGSARNVHVSRGSILVLANGNTLLLKHCDVEKFTEGSDGCIYGWLVRVIWIYGMKWFCINLLIYFEIFCWVTVFLQNGRLELLTHARHLSNWT